MTPEMNPAPSHSEAPIRPPSPLAGEALTITPSPLAGEALTITPSPLAGEGWDGGSPTQRWHVIRSKPRAESTARAQLERQGFRVYFPQLVKPARVRGRWLDRIEPLFPRYLFLALDSCMQSLAPVSLQDGSVPKPRKRLATPAQAGVQCGRALRVIHIMLLSTV